MVTTPVYLKWMLCFEDPDTRTVWIAKATPRDWLSPQEVRPHSPHALRMCSCVVVWWCGAMLEGRCADVWWCRDGVVAQCFA